ncbi:MAG: thioredoxin fold domain-containing protein [Deltaproteobacteria bacterium]|nr:thioredoxin fold domain-containing protein [Deltaproteobacteria bacterium]
MALPVVAEHEFETKVLRSELPVLVDFFADWCAPCKQMNPELEALATELAGKAEVVKVDIDRAQRLAGMLRIQSVPTYIAFFQGRPVGAERGVVPRARLRELLEPYFPRAEGAIRAQELSELLKQHAVVPVDTRDAFSFGRARIPGAKHIPLEELEGRLAELYMLGQPVLYCRSGDRTKELAEKLARDGVGLPFLEGGFLMWEADMLPIEKP